MLHNIDQGIINLQPDVMRAVTRHVVDRAAESAATVQAVARELPEVARSLTGWQTAIALDEAAWVSSEAAAQMSQQACADAETVDSDVCRTLSADKEAAASFHSSVGAVNWQS